MKKTSVAYKDTTQVGTKITVKRAKLLTDPPDSPLFPFFPSAPDCPYNRIEQNRIFYFPQYPFTIKQQRTIKKLA